MLETGSIWIINMAPIQNSLAIYKDTSIFIAEYTGSGEEHITYNPELAALAEGREVFEERYEYPRERALQPPPTSPEPLIQKTPLSLGKRRTSEFEEA